MDESEYAEYYFALKNNHCEQNDAQGVLHVLTLMEILNSLERILLFDVQYNVEASAIPVYCIGKLGKRVIARRQERARINLRCVCDGEHSRSAAKFLLVRKTRANGARFPETRFGYTVQYIVVSVL